MAATPDPAVDNDAPWQRFAPVPGRLLPWFETGRRGK
jgi:hypothetical protein